MRRRPPLVAIALALLLVTAGCTVVSVPDDFGGGGDSGEQLATDGSITAPTGEWSTELHPRQAGIGQSDPVRVDGDLPVNATSVWRRTERLLGVSAPAPSVEVLEEARLPTEQLQPSSVQRAIGYGAEQGSFRACGMLAHGFASGDTVHLSTVDPVTGANLSDSTLELILAHEYAHVLQGEVEGYDDAAGVENRVVGRAMSEGSAVIVAESYAREFDRRWGEWRPLELRACLYERSRNQLRTNAGAYYFGGRYFPQRVDALAELPTAFDDPPRTSEQLLRGETPATEPEAPLAIEAEPGSTWEERQRGWNDEIGTGELAVRTWLGEGLPQDRVDAAATGWGAGAATTLENDSGAVAVAWALRWDSPGDADQFEAAATDIQLPLEARANTELRAVRVAPETVVVLGGPGGFVEEAGVSGSNASVIVGAPGA